MVNDNLDQLIKEWLVDNYALVADIYFPLKSHMNTLLESYDDVFKDAIRSNFKQLFISMICLECCRSLGISAEHFYTVLDDDLYYFVVDNLDECEYYNTL